MFVSEKGIYPRPAAATLCQLAKFSVQIRTDPPRPKYSGGFENKVIKTLYVLNDLICVNDIEAVGIKRPLILEVGWAGVNTQSHGGVAGVSDLNSGNRFGPNCFCDLHRPCAIVATDVK